MAKRKVFSIGSSLSDGLEQTIAAAHNYANELRIDVIPLKNIEIDPDNPRELTLTPLDLFNELDINDPFYSLKMEEKKSLESLANSIIDQGIINPIMVYEHNQKYRLIAGERRTLASILAGKLDIQAKILNSRPTELKIRILQWIENIERSDLSLKERLDNLHKIFKAFSEQNKIKIQDIRITDISKLIGCTKSHAINLKLVFFAENDIKVLITTNKIKSLEKAALICSINSKFLRQKSINECVNGASLKAIKKLVELDKRNLPEEEIENYFSKKALKQNSINLACTTKSIVAKAIIESVINHLSLDIYLDELKFDSPESITKSFKILVSHLECIYE